MNAPIKADHLAQPKVELLPLTSITPSETLVQAKRRARYDATALEQLAETIKDAGVLMPIVVRPLAALRGLANYELIAGERRWLASEKAGFAHIPARIVELNDAQVLKAQLVENLHREQLDTLAEAQGYRELIDSGVKAEEIAAVIGRSRSYVFARIQLLELAPEIQEAMKDGELDASHALMFARVPKQLQDKAWKSVWGQIQYAGGVSVREIADLLRDRAKLFPNLKGVPFSLSDITFVLKQKGQPAAALASCDTCPKRSGNDAELAAALEGDLDVCTDKLCHDAKAKMHFEREADRIKLSGREILTGDAAAEIIPGDYFTRGYVALDSECDADRFPEPEPEQEKGENEEAFEKRAAEWDARSEAYKPRTYRQLLGDDLSSLELKVVQDPKNKTRLLELAPDKNVTRLLKEKGFKLELRREPKHVAEQRIEESKPKDPEAARRQAEKQAAEQARLELDERVSEQTDARVFKGVYDAFKGPLKRDDLELVAEHLLEQYEFEEAIGRTGAFKKRPWPATMNERDLARLIVVGIVVDRLLSNNDERPIKALAKRLKIDPKAIEKQVRAELAGGAQPKKGKGK